MPLCRSVKVQTFKVAMFALWTLIYLILFVFKITSLTSPMKRDFQVIPNAFLGPSSVPDSINPLNLLSFDLRVLQFNILADGLSGLRGDLGGFSRVKREFMLWEHRRNLLLAEILQYDPDVITLQECDHYYDFFFPMLYVQGYEGIFAPKPASACLEVSNSPDGCAIFYRRSKFKILSSEIGTYALSKSELKGFPPQKDKSIQNQVYAILCAEFLQSSLHSSLKSSTAQSLNPAFLLATTHLKASKTAEGERFRLLETKELLENIKIFEMNMLKHQGRRTALILTGDMNACPQNTHPKENIRRLENRLSSNNIADQPTTTMNYDSSVYQFLKSHDYQFRSVLNDDLYQLKRGEDPAYGADNIWTTWKARKKQQNKESVVKHCIDYILYEPYKAEKGIGIQTKAVLQGFLDSDVDQEFLFPNPRYSSDHVSVAADLKILVNP